MGSVNEGKLRFCIDRGGTSADVYAEIPCQPDGRVLKLLSVDPFNYDDAPVEGIWRILEEFTGEKIPCNLKIPTEKIEWIRMGTTVATNALLEQGLRCVWLKAFAICSRLVTRLAPTYLTLLCQSHQISMKELQRWKREFGLFRLRKKKIRVHCHHWLKEFQGSLSGL